MAASEARNLIAALSARGWSYGKIGQVLSRDPSLIRQAAIGKKPGNNLIPGLQELVTSGRGPSLAYTARIEAPRRLTRGGTPAAVRQPVKAPAVPRGRLETTRLGQIVDLPSGQKYVRLSGTGQARAALDVFEGLGPKTRLHASYQDKQGNWHHIGTKGGYKIDNLRGRLQGPRGGRRSWRQAIRSLIYDVYGPGAALPAGAIIITTAQHA